jgi:phosphohistidine phosphatase
MLLFLVQHGEAVPKDVDPERPLSLQGENDVKRLAIFLKKSGVRVARLFHSGKTRARQTAEILAKELLSKGEIEVTKGIDPNDPVAPFSSKIRKLKHDTLIVGHLPFLARLIAHLTTGNEESQIVEYHPGGAVCLERDDEPGWRIRWMLSPDLIK